MVGEDLAVHAEFTQGVVAVGLAPARQAGLKP